MIRIHSAEWYIEIDCFILSFFTLIPGIGMYVVVPVVVSVVVIDCPTLIVCFSHVLIVIGGYQL